MARVCDFGELGELAGYHGTTSVTMVTRNLVPTLIGGCSEKWCQQCKGTKSWAWCPAESPTDIAPTQYFIIRYAESVYWYGDVSGGLAGARERGLRGLCVGPQKKLSHFFFGGFGGP